MHNQNQNLKNRFVGIFNIAYSIIIYSKPCIFDLSEFNLKVILVSFHYRDNGYTVEALIKFDVKRCFTPVSALMPDKNYFPWRLRL